jgi:hypothetical protein
VKKRGDAWRERKKAYFKRHKKVCAACGCVGTNYNRIHLHHVVYGPRIGTEPDDHLVPLCGTHHAEVHRLHKRAADKPNLREATRRIIEKRNRHART